MAELFIEDNNSGTQRQPNRAGHSRKTELRTGIQTKLRMGDEVKLRDGPEKPR